MPIPFLIAWLVFGDPWITLRFKGGDVMSANAPATRIKQTAPRASRSRISAVIAILVCAAPNVARADAGGVSFWVPGMFGSLAAAPGQPGWALGMIYYHTSVDASREAAASKQVEIRRFHPSVNLNLNVDLDARGDLGFFAPSYTFETPVLGGQLSVSMLTVVGRLKTTLDGTLTASLGPLTTTRQGTLSDSVVGFGDLYPQATLKWNSGVHNFMTYITGDIPVGDYDPNRLSNIGIGHAAIDGGLGYTYFDPTKGHEFSVVGGLTHNFRNPDTDYRNGLDLHVDWAASQWLSKQFFVGVVGYAYQQLTADSGQPAILGAFKSRVFGIGPQIGYVFPAANGIQGFLGLKGYYEFEAENRPEGWNTWVTLAFTPAEKPKPTARPMISK
jgi:hypothetical protein